MLSCLNQAPLFANFAALVHNSFETNRFSIDMNILVSVNSAFVKPLCVLLSSLVSTNGTGHSIFLLHSSLSEKEIFRLKSFVSKKCYSSLIAICVRDVDFLFPETGNRLSIETYYRLLVADYLPNSIDRVLWLDADTLVLKDISNLYNSPLDGYCLAACLDIDADVHSARLHLKSPYFNAGVVLFNLRAAREYLRHESLASFFHNNKKPILLHDQDILNLIFENKTIIIPKRYNVITLGSQKHDANFIREVSRDCHILHYAGMYKPWHRFYLSRLDRFYFGAMRQGHIHGALVLRIWHIGARIGHQLRRFRRNIVGFVSQRCR